MKQKLLTLLLLHCMVMAFGQVQEKDTWRLFYLGGQSNMDGYGYNSELPDSLNRTFNEAYIFHGNPVGDNEKGGGEGVWTRLQPGHGAGFSASTSGNKYSDRFGIELSFVSALQKQYPNDKIAIIKYSRGGTSLDSLASYAGSWDPAFSGLNQYDHFLATLKNALSTNDIDYNGVADILQPQGIIWMQGESDAAYTDTVAREYLANLEQMMQLLRAALHNNDLPVVIGKISDSQNDADGRVWDYLELVQEAQEKFSSQDNNAAIVKSTMNYKYSDPWHYNSNGFVDLGIRFADAIKQLNNLKE